MKKRSLIQPIFLFICVHFRSSAVEESYFRTEEFTAETQRSPRDAEEYGVTTSFIRPLSSSAFISVHLRLKNLTFGVKSSPKRRSSDGSVGNKMAFQFVVFFGFDQTQKFTTIDEVMLKQFAATTPGSRQGIQLSDRLTASKDVGWTSTRSASASRLEIAGQSLTIRLSRSALRIFPKRTQMTLGGDPSSMIRSKKSVSRVRMVQSFSRARIHNSLSLGCDPPSVAWEHSTGRSCARDAGRFSSINRCFTRPAARWNARR